MAPTIALWRDLDHVLIGPPGRDVDIGVTANDP
jgi:hypothetical protein